MAIRKGKVTIMDDDESSRQTLQCVLGNDYQVACYEDGRSGLQAIKQNLPDVVIIDINMPHMDGIEVIREIRNDPRLANVYAIALSADEIAGGRKGFLGLGFDEYVHKPVLDFMGFKRTVASHVVTTA